MNELRINKTTIGERGGGGGGNSSSQRLGLSFVSKRNFPGKAVNSLSWLSNDQ